jgi:CO/xanthine dehydrogenase Mo-binding subunit
VQADAEVGLRFGWWRAVYASQNAFPDECFIDELAVAAGKDPLAFRLEHLPPGNRLRAVLQLAADKAEWGKPLPAGRGRGIACYSSFGSHVAEVAEVSVRKGNFDDYQPLRFDEMPAVEVHVVPSLEAQGGMGLPIAPCC